MPTQIHPRTRTYIPAREPKPPQEQHAPEAAFQRNDTIRVVEAAPLVSEVSEAQAIYHSPPIQAVSIPPPARATASSHIGSRVHVFGEDRDRRLQSQSQSQNLTSTQTRSNTMSRLRQERETTTMMLMSPHEEGSSSDRTTLSGAPLPVEVVDVEREPAKKRPRWKRLLGIGKKPKKDKVQRRVLVRDRGRFGAEGGHTDRETKKSFVEWD